MTGTEIKSFSTGHRLKAGLGRFLFIVGFPVLWVYFRSWPKRTRVMVVHDGKLLLVKGWLSDGTWGLPGGGARRHEPLVESAVRELYEEVGVVALPSQLVFLEEISHQERRLRYAAVYFYYLPKSLPQLTRQEREIAEIGWFTRGQMKGMRLNIDARYAVENFLADLL